MLQKNFIGRLADYVSESVYYDEKSKKKAETEFALLEYLENVDSEDKVTLYSLFSEWMIFDAKLPVFNNSSGLEYFVKHNPLSLSANLLADYKKMLDSYIAGFFEIIKLEPGRGILIADADMNSYFVKDVSASMGDMSEGNIVWMRIANIDGYHIVSSRVFDLKIKLKDGVKDTMLVKAGNKKTYIGADKITETLFAPIPDNDESNKDIDISSLSRKEKEEKLKEAEQQFKKAIKACGMQKILNPEIVKSWTRKRSLPAGFEFRAVFYLIPEHIDDIKRKQLLDSCAEYLNVLNSLKRRKKKNTKEQEFIIDALSYEKYQGYNDKALRFMRENKFEDALEVFDEYLALLLDDKTPIFPAFRIYANAAVSAFALANNDPLVGVYAFGEELLDSALRLNPKYEFAIKIKKSIDSSFKELMKAMSDDEQTAFKYIYDANKKMARREYRNSFFAKYEEFIVKTCGISLEYNTKNSEELRRIM